APSDCGVSTSFKSVTDSNFATFNFEGDTALVCMGKNVINGCVNSHATVDAGTVKNLLEIKGTENDCQVNIVFSGQNVASPSNLQCPISKLIPLDAQGKTSNGTTIGQI